MGSSQLVSEPFFTQQQLSQLMKMVEKINKRLDVLSLQVQANTEAIQKNYGEGRESKSLQKQKNEGTYVEENLRNQELPREEEEEEEEYLAMDVSDKQKPFSSANPSSESKSEDSYERNKKKSKCKVASKEWVISKKLPANFFSALSSAMGGPPKGEKLQLIDIQNQLWVMKITHYVIFDPGGGILKIEEEEEKKEEIWEFLERKREEKIVGQWPPLQVESQRRALQDLAAASWNEFADFADYSDGKLKLERGRSALRKLSQVRMTERFFSRKMTTNRVVLDSKPPSLTVKSTRAAAAAVTEMKQPLAGEEENILVYSQSKTFVRRSLGFCKALFGVPP